MFLAFDGPTHLEPMPDYAGENLLGLLRAVARLDDDIARHHQLGRIAGAQLRQAPADELIDVAVIIGEQHPGLHVAPVRTRIMHEAAQGIIHPRSVEEREGPLVATANFVLAVGDFVADNGERGRGEMARKFRSADAAAPEFVAALERIGVSDFLRT